MSRFFSTVALTALFLALIPATLHAQIWVDQSSTRFPQPDPAEYTNYLDIGDIDNDGDLDIVWANGPDYNVLGPAQLERIYINNGAGVFTDESIARGAVSGNARGVELGDLDNDGDLDIVYAQDFNKQPIVMINSGPPTYVFTNQSAARLPATTYSSSRIALGDIDNDGDLDMYICNSGTTNRFGSGQNHIYINNGAGVFTDETATRHPVAVLPEAMDAIFGDIDGDFDLDVRTASTGTNGSRLYRNDGTGVFTTVSGVPSDANCYSYDFGDIDNDGDLDLIGANANGSGNNSELLLRNDGTGAYTNISANLSPNPTVDDNDSKFLDYDNDGDLDLIVARLGGTTGERIYNNNGAGLFTQVLSQITPISDSTLDIKAADLNGDGKLDIVTAQGESGSFINRIYINNTGPADTRGPTIVATEQKPNTSSTGPYVIRAAILDGVSSDRSFWDKGIVLKYSFDAAPPSQVTMRYSGGQIYRGVIPSAPSCSSISYFVVATDFANNATTGPTKFFNVTPGPPIGDLDADTIVDDKDADILAQVLVEVDTDPAHVCRADINGDSIRDGNDIIAFVNLFH